MYIKFVMSGYIEYNYLTLGKLLIYNKNNKIIPTTQSKNVISSGYKNNNTTTGFNNLFNSNLDFSSNIVPNCSNYNYSNVTLIMNISETEISKILVKSFGAGTAKVVDIYTSPDNKTYEHANTITFTSYNETIIVPMLKYQYLIYYNNKHYSISDSNYDIDSKCYIPLANTNGLNNLFKDNGIILDDLFVKKTINGETFSPINKFDKFMISKHI